MGRRRALIALAALAAACGLELQGTLTPGDGADAGLDEGSPPIDGPATDAAEAGDDGGSDAIANDAAEASPPCTNTATDALNCGRCGHSCLGGVCLAGVCQPRVLVSGVTDLRAVALDAARAYYCDAVSGDLRAVPLTGGAPQLVYATAQAPRDIVVTPDKIYWIDQTKVGVVLLDAGSPSSYTPATQQPVTLALNGGSVFFATLGGTVDALDLLLANHQIFATAQANPAAVAADATYVYWVETSAGTIRRAPRAGGAVDVVVTGEAAGPQSLAVDATSVYFTTSIAVKRAPLGANVVAVPLAATESNPLSIAVDGSGVYWIDMTSGALRYLPAGTGTPVTLVTETQKGGIFTQLVALDPVSVVYGVRQTGEVKRLAKP